MMVGTTIGAGIFGLPYVASKSGFLLTSVLIIVLGFITLLVNLMYGEVTLRTKKKAMLSVTAENIWDAAEKELRLL